MFKNIYILIFCVFSSPLFSNSFPKAKSLLSNLDMLYRMESSHAIIKMEITNPKWTYKRKLDLEIWSKGTKFTLIRVLSPKKDKGISTLKRFNEMWNFFPKINKQIKIPPSMMMVNWMGSDFTNDDLAKESSYLNDFIISSFKESSNYIVSIVPKKDTISLWNKIDISFDKKTGLPLEHDYYNEKNIKIRSLVFSDVHTFKTKKVPRRLTMHSFVEQGQSTTIYYEKLDFDIKLEDNFFSFQNLKKGK